jgi:hypothetical protein
VAIRTRGQLAPFLFLFVVHLRALCGPDASGLEAGLTPFGAQIAGSADGRISAWEGGLVEPPLAYQGPGQHHPDPFPDDRPLFVIDSSNLDQHSGFLSAGQQALFKTYPDTFRIPVFVSRRTHAAPQWVYDNTARNFASARLIDNGNGFEGAYGGIPFPVPKQALEVYWNHVARWRGRYIQSRATDANVYANGKFTLVSRQTRIKFNFYDPDGSVDTVGNRLFSLISKVTAPARQAGGGALILETINQEAEARHAWLFDAGRRRVLRAPTLSHDTSVNDADGLRTADDTDLINGSPIRFDFKLLGKRELFIPYNNYRLAEKGVSYKDLLQPGHLNPDYLRYELHRVWVLEARLKPEWRHVYSRRVFFVDEDSWTIAIADQYDSNEQIWRVSMAYLKNFYELPATLPTAFVFHDLQSHRYHVQGLDSEQPKAPLTQLEVPGDNRFTPSALRRFVR